jgi:STE24 endopeptidase
MTTLSVSPPATATPRRAGHFGAWRALSTVPAMVGSVLLVVMLFGWLGAWEPVALLAWMASGVSVFSRHGERAAVRVGAGFRRLTSAQSALVTPAWSTALARCGLSAGEVDLYVRRSQDPNAFAAGGRSVAVTTGVLTKCSAHGTGTEYLVAILTHELGHHATRATRFALVTMWLALPWRLAFRLVVGIGLATIGRRQPLRLLACVALAGVMDAVVQAMQGRQWVVAVVLTVVAVCTVVCPLVDAAVSRRSEYAADRYAADAGLGPQLAAALHVLSRGEHQRPRTVARLLSRHPSAAQRIAALSEATLGSRSRRPGSAHRR